MEMTRVDVPFEKKARARELGAFFNKNDRRWYVPENASEDVARLLMNLATETEEKTEEKEEDCNTHADDNETEIVTGSVLQREQLEQLLSENGKPEMWTDVIESRDTLKAAMAVRDYGMPESEEQREGVLKVLALRRPTDYQIDYDMLMQCSESFARLYSNERVTELLVGCITGSQNYADDIKNSNYTAEEKALLNFVLPLKN